MTAAALELTQLSESGRAPSISEPAIQQAIEAVVRLYEAACLQARREIVPVGPEVSTTAAITLACALVRSQSLTPFDFALWFSHTAAAGENGPDREVARLPRRGE